MTFFTFNADRLRVVAVDWAGRRLADMPLARAVRSWCLDDDRNTVYYVDDTPAIRSITLTY